jgi:hypothetical protein
MPAVLTLLLCMNNIFLHLKVFERLRNLYMLNFASSEEHALRLGVVTSFYIL